MKKDNKTNFIGVKKVVGAKEITKAGLTLGIGFMVLPFIPFKEARNYEPFKNKDKSKHKSKDKKWL